MRLRRPRDDGDPAERLRAVVAGIARQRDVATRNAAVAMVNESKVRQLLAAQRADLDDARRTLDDAVAAADALAARVRAEDGDAEAAVYQSHADGLRLQHGVIDLAQGQLAGVDAAAGEQTRQARQLLLTSRQTLDGALGEQLRLLSAVQRLESARRIAEVRAGHPPRR